MNTLPSSRSAKRIPQLALRFGALPDGAISWSDGCSIVYLGREITVRLSTHQGGAELDGDELHLPLPPKASGRQVQDSAEAWLRQQCVSHVEDLVALLIARQLVLACSVGFAQPTRFAGAKQCLAQPLLRRRSIRIQLSFAARSPWIAVDDAETLRCNWRLIELAPAVIEQHAEKALGQVAALHSANATTDMFGALPA